MTPAESFDQLDQRLREHPERVAGLTATFQFRLSGDQGGTWYLRVVDGKPEVHEGEVPHPEVTVLMHAADYVDMATGKLDGAEAFMSGKMRVSGDSGLGMRLAEITQ